MANNKVADEQDVSSARSIWVRGLLVIVLAIFFGLAESILIISAIVQFFWMLFSGQRNPAIVDFGKNLAKWLEQVTLFQTGASKELPFPWRRWKQDD